MEDTAISQRWSRWSRRVREALAPDAVWARTDETAQQYRTVLSFWLVGAMPWPMIYAAVYGFLVGSTPAGWMCVGCVALYAPVPWLMTRGVAPRTCGNWMVAVMLATLLALGLVTGGAGSPALPWLLAVPLVAVHIAGIFAALVWSGLAMLVFLGFDLWRHAGLECLQTVTASQLEILTSLGHVGLIVLIATLAGTYDQQRVAAVRLADVHQLRLSDALEEANRHAEQLAMNSEALRISEERLRLALEATTDAMWDCNLATGETHFSPRWLTMLGYGHDAMPSTFETWTRLTHPDDVARVMAIVHATSPSDNAFEAEFRMRDADGEWRWIRGCGRVISTDAQGRPARILGTNSDIHERKRAELALIREKQFSEAIFASLPGAAYVFSEDGQLIRWNHYWRELGWTPETLQLARLPETVAPADRARMSKVMNDVLQTGASSTEVELTGPNGRCVPHFCTGVRVELHGERFIVGSGTEMSELRRATRALAETESLYQKLVQNSPMGMIFYTLEQDDALILTDANPAADRLLGIDLKTRIGMRIEQVFPELVSTEVPSRFRAAARDGTPWTTEQIDYDDGQVAGAFELRAFQTGPRRMVVVFMSIRDRLAAEAAVRATERQVAMEAGKAEVATDVLHNVGNVLSQVRVSTSLLNEALRASEAPTLALVARAVNENADDLPRFLSQDERGRRLPAFLDQLAEILAAEHASQQKELSSLSAAVEHIARIVSMQQVHNKKHGLVELVRPGDVFEQALSISLASSSSTSVCLERLFDELPTAPMHRHKVLQILVNLLNNARHAVAGPEVSRPTVRLILSGCDIDGVPGVRFAVQDNGMGISADNLPRIFGYGFTTRDDGHGFGLHSAANLAQELGGSLTVSSDGPGLGAVFTLLVPNAVTEALT